MQVLGASLEAHVYASDNSALARDCRRDIKAANAKLLKLGRKVNATSPSLQTAAPQGYLDGLLLGLQHGLQAV